MAVLLVPVMGIKALPIIAGAYVGRGFVQGHVSESVTSAPHDVDAAPVKIRPAFLACWLVSGAAGLTLRDPWLLAAWLGSAAAFAALFSVSIRLRPFRSAAVAIVGTLIGFVASLMRDAVFGGPSHNLLPIELSFVVLVVSVTAIAAAWTAFGLKRWFGRICVA